MRTLLLPAVQGKHGVRDVQLGIDAPMLLVTMTINGTLCAMNAEQADELAMGLLHMSRNVREARCMERRMRD